VAFLLSGLVEAGALPRSGGKHRGDEKKFAERLNEDLGGGGASFLSAECETVLSGQNPNGLNQFTYRLSL
jgi:hypothetical protein